MLVAPEEAFDQEEMRGDSAVEALLRKSCAPCPVCEQRALVHLSGCLQWASIQGTAESRDVAIKTQLEVGVISAPGSLRTCLKCTDWSARLHEEIDSFFLT